MNKYWVILVLLVSVVFIPRPVVLTAKGFSPKFIVVIKDADVTFRNDSDTYFWPASDPHPLHIDYPIFDAQDAIAPGGAWKFRFSQSGIFRYHDHLAPQFRGIVVVIGAGKFRLDFSGKRLSEEQLYKTCGGLNKDCWDKVFTGIVQRQGSTAALVMIDQLRRSHPDFANYCHQYVDFVGELSYWSIPARLRMALFDEHLASQCSSGYLHGYMGEFISHGNVLEGIAFCDTIHRLYPDSDVGDECYRGIGNGMAFRYGLTFWNDEKRIVERALAQCDQVRKKDVCIHGVFTGVDHMHFGVHGFELRRSPQDPFALCRGRDPHVEELCYDGLIGSFFSAVEYDLDQAAEHIRLLPVAYARIVLDRVVRIPYELRVFDEQNHRGIVTWCRSFDGDLKEVCLKGFIQKLLSIDLDYNETSHLARNFCAFSFLHAYEKNFCTDVVDRN